MKLDRLRLLFRPSKIRPDTNLGLTNDSDNYLNDTFSKKGSAAGCRKISFLPLGALGLTIEITTHIGRIFESNKLLHHPNNKTNRQTKKIP
jgi:hypothetical protein